MCLNLDLSLWIKVLKKLSWYYLSVRSILKLITNQERRLFLLLAWSKFSSKKRESSTGKCSTINTYTRQNNLYVYLNNVEHYKGLETLRNRSSFVLVSGDHNRIWPGGCVLHKPTWWTSSRTLTISKSPCSVSWFLFIVRLWWLWTLAPCLIALWMCTVNTATASIYEILQLVRAQCWDGLSGG